MRFLITGAAGFLGSALANRLVQDGHAVRGLDDLSTGDPGALLPEVHFIRGDVNDRPKLWTLLQDVDCVYHLAARVLVPESVLYPREYANVNVDGTVSIMEAIRDVGIGRVILASSGAIYGNQDEQPIQESVVPIPLSPYAVSKLSAEYFVNTIGAINNIDTVCLRIFNAYGPGQHIPPVHAPVIMSFLKHALSNGTLVVHGDGSQTRDYIYVDDVVNALVSAATAPDVNRQIINVGSGTETSLKELVRVVLKVTSRKPEVVYNLRSDAGNNRMAADISLAARKLRWRPTVDLETGIRNTMELDPRFAAKIAAAGADAASLKRNGL